MQEAQGLVAGITLLDMEPPSHTKGQCRRVVSCCDGPMLFLLLLMLLLVLPSGSDAASFTATAETTPATLDPPFKSLDTFMPVTFDTYFII